MPAAPAITLAEAQAMSPAALAERLLPGEKHGPIVDAVVNGEGMMSRSASVQRVFLMEQLVPFDQATCRSRVYEIKMGHSDPSANTWSQALPTQPVKVEQSDGLWVPPGGDASVSACAAAPRRTWGFGSDGIGLAQAAALVRQAREAFRDPGRRLKIRCRGEGGQCGKSPRKILASIDWSQLGLVEQVDSKGEGYYVGDPKPKDPPWGPRHVQFSFPYAAARGATWVITVDRTPAIRTVRMEAATIVYH